MAWQGIYGHDEIVDRLRQSLARGRLASTFLFVGPAGVGKRTFAKKFAQGLLCTARPEAELNPCGQCPSCKQVLAGTHPDLMIVSKPPEKSSIPLELLIGEGSKRMREGLCHDLGLRPFMGGRKVAIINDADYLGTEASNCLLKTLEEPPPNSVLILVGSSPEQQLPTIRSRSQIVWFKPLDAPTVERVLVERGLVTDAAQAHSLAAYSDGSVTQALEMAQPELWDFRSDLLRRLAGMASGESDAIELSRDVIEFVEQAGKEAPLRRARAKHVLGFIVAFYHGIVRQLAGSEPHGDDNLRSAVATAVSSWPGDAELATAYVERCLDTMRHIDEMTNVTLALDACFDAISVPARAR